jgi:hypothetical protein
MADEVSFLGVVEWSEILQGTSDERAQPRATTANHLVLFLELHASRDEAELVPELSKVAEYRHRQINKGNQNVHHEAGLLELLRLPLSCGD